jgi:hypothetical protein
MTLSDRFARTGRGLAAGAAILTAVGLATVPRPAHAVGPGEAVGIGLGAFAAGTVLGAAANPYYSPYGYSYPSAPAYYPSAPAYYPSAPTYYPSAPAYYPAAPYYPSRSCWDPYYGRYYAC